MPYRLSRDGKAVMVKRGKRWRILKTHSTKAKARAHLRALQANVKH